MALGMTYEEYWYDDVFKARAFLKADKMRQERVNEEAWLYGLYVYGALSATVGNFGRKKGETPIEYPNKPIVFDAQKLKEEKEQRAAQEQEKERLRLVAYLNQVADRRRNSMK